MTDQRDAAVPVAGAAGRVVVRVPVDVLDAEPAGLIEIGCNLFGKPSSGLRSYRAGWWRCRSPKHDRQRVGVVPCGAS
jgi:hypothetical protein